MYSANYPQLNMGRDFKLDSIWNYLGICSVKMSYRPVKIVTYLLQECTMYIFTTTWSGFTLHNSNNNLV